MSDEQHYIRVRGRVQGPFTTDQLHALARRGQFSRLHEISVDGQTWSRAAEKPEIFPAAPARVVATAVTAGLGGRGSALSTTASGTVAGGGVAEWYYSHQGAQMGPVALDTLRAMWATRQLQPTDLLWKPSMADWTPAGELPEFRSDAGAPVAPSAAAPDSTIVFGRDASCDQVLDSPLVSRRHARLTRRGDDYLIEDLNSTSGTFLNGTRIRGAVAVQPGNFIGLGNCMFVLAADGSIEKCDYRGNVTLEARDVTVVVPRRRLLDKVSLTIFPSEFVGLMGSSGAGKTTLMTALNGYAPPTDGHVTINGIDIYANGDQFRGSIGYVPQDDIVHRELTVWQALYYTALLRLPADYTGGDIESRISSVLSDLGLAGTEDVLIGSPETAKGISGGQRKRLNLAMELITDPSVLFLDEPTSGLSSADTLMVMRMLRKLADGGKTILLTIHQPSLEAFKLMDNLVFLGRDRERNSPGKVVYYGPAYPDAVAFFNPSGVPNVQSGVDAPPEAVEQGYHALCAQFGHAEIVSRYSTSAYYREYVEQRSGQRVRSIEQEVSTTNSRRTAWRHWAVLAKRGFAIKAKDRWNTLILLAQAPIVGLLISAVFGEQVAGADADAHPLQASSSLSIALFLVVLSALWFGSSNAIRDIVGEAAIYRRERMVGLSLVSYIGSKFTVLAGLCAIQCVTLLALVAGSCPFCKLTLP